MTLNTTTRLRQLLNGTRIIVAPGSYDALSARIVEQAGFQTVYVSGAGVSSSLLGFPDLGLLSFSEMLGQVRRIAAAVSIPVIADADTGFGNALNVWRTVREYERAGVSALHLEDQSFPKKCGHFEGKRVIEAEEMVEKVRAAVDARRDADFVIIARTDARAVHGFAEAIRRANLYREAGADVIFVEAPQTIEELRELPKRVPGPLLANMVEGGKTPQLSASELQELGFKLVILPGSLQRAAMHAMVDLAAKIRVDGSTYAELDRIASFERRNEINGLNEFAALERRYVLVKN